MIKSHFLSERDYYFQALRLKLDNYREKCKLDFCSDLCIKKELGEDENKKPGWTMYFSRAPINSDTCITACYFGCMNKDPEDDDGGKGDDKKD